MKPTRSLSLRAERLTELSSDEMRVVNAGASIADIGCLVIRYPSDWFVSVCECVTRTCT